MKVKKRSRLLVVDASVLHSAGVTQHPVSSACRESLEAMRKICHRAVRTPGLSEECVRHASRFSRKWLRSMTARKKVIPCDVPTIDFDLSDLGERDREAVQKDRVLLEAALAADRVIVTSDERLRCALGRGRESRRFLAEIRWINPLNDGAAALAKLSRQ